MNVLMHVNIKPDSNPYYFAITARRLEKAYIHISHIEEMDAPPSIHTSKCVSTNQISSPSTHGEESSYCRDCVYN
jgi:hypothetical protein